MDPILQRSFDYNQPSVNLEEERRALQERLDNIKRAQEVTRPYVAGAAPSKPQCPIWDEINSVINGMSDQELQFLESNQEYRESSAVIEAILQREYLRVMRPIVEGTKDGKDALDKHLTLLKRLRKTAKDEANRRYMLMDEYMSNYSHMSYKEFIAMKQQQQKGGAR